MSREIQRDRLTPVQLDQTLLSHLRKKSPGSIIAEPQVSLDIGSPLIAMVKQALVNLARLNPKHRQHLALSADEHTSLPLLEVDVNPLVEHPRLEERAEISHLVESGLYEIAGECQQSRIGKLSATIKITLPGLIRSIEGCIVSVDVPAEATAH